MTTIPYRSQHPAILRVVTYHRRDFDHSVIFSGRSQHDAIRSSIVTTFAAPPLVCFGNFECFPMEILLMICLQLDARTVFNLSQANRQARKMISNIHEYRMLATHGLECLRAVLRTGMSKHRTISDLYDDMCFPGCQVCKAEYGGFLFLPSWKRCCFRCIKLSPELRIVSVAALAQYALVSRRTLRRYLPTLRSIPGHYSPNCHSRRSRIALASPPQSRRALSWLDLTRRMQDDVINGMREMKFGRFMACVPLPVFNPRTGDVDHGVCCKGCQVAVERRDYDFDMEGELPNDNDMFIRMRDLVYSKRGYLQHFVNCREAKDMWNRSRGGTVRVKEPRFTEQGGETFHTMRD